MRPRVSSRSRVDRKDKAQAKRAFAAAYGPSGCCAAARLWSGRAMERQPKPGKSGSTMSPRHHISEQHDRSRNLAHRAWTRIARLTIAAIILFSPVSRADAPLAPTGRRKFSPFRASAGAVAAGKGTHYVRDFPPALDQGAKQNACTGFAVAYAAQGRLFRNRLSDGVYLSPAFMYDNLRAASGKDCSSGVHLADAVEFAVEEGGMPHSEYAYEADSCGLRAQPTAATHEFRVDDAEQIVGEGRDRLNSIVAALLEDRVVMAQIRTGDLAAWKNRPNGDIFHQPLASGPEHAIAIVGYDVVRDAFVVLNSWGNDWGTDRDGTGLIDAMTLVGGITDAYVFQHVEPTAADGDIALVDIAGQWWKEGVSVYFLLTGTRVGESRFPFLTSIEFRCEGDAPLAANVVDKHLYEREDSSHRLRLPHAKQQKVRILVPEGESTFQLRYEIDKGTFEDYGLSQCRVVLTLGYRHSSRYHTIYRSHSADLSESINALPQ